MIPGTQSGDINHIQRKMECNLLSHSLAVLKPSQFDRSSARQHEGWEITDEMMRFLFGGGTKFPSDRRMFLVQYCFVSSGRMILLEHGSASRVGLFECNYR